MPSASQTLRDQIDAARHSIQTWTEILNVIEGFVPKDTSFRSDTGYQTEGDGTIYRVPPGFVPQASVDSRDAEIVRLKESLSKALSRGDRYLEKYNAVLDRLRRIRNITEYEEPGKVPHAGA